MGALITPLEERGDMALRIISKPRGLKSRKYYFNIFPKVQILRYLSLSSNNEECIPTRAHEVSS